MVTSIMSAISNMATLVTYVVFLSCFRSFFSSSPSPQASRLSRFFIMIMSSLRPTFDPYKHFEYLYSLMHHRLPHVSRNAPDFASRADRPSSALWPQLISVPLTFSLVSFIGIIVSSSSQTIYGEAIWSPIDLLNKFLDDSPSHATRFGVSVDVPHDRCVR
jgi:hypothetical protein